MAQRRKLNSELFRFSSGDSLSQNEVREPYEAVTAGEAVCWEKRLLSLL